MNPCCKFNEARAIAKHGGRLAFAISLGRDSAVMLHLMGKFTDLKKHFLFYWSQYPELLPYQEKYISLLERTYGVKINVLIWPELLKVKQADAVREILEKNCCALCCFGYRMDESLQRRGMLKALENGIDEKRQWAYPLRSFTKRTVRGYADANRIPLNVEYRIGLTHDMLSHRGVNAIILRHFVSEKDYQAAIRQDRNVEVDYERLINDEEAWDKVFGNEDKNIRGLTKGFRCPNPPKLDC